MRFLPLKLKSALAVKIYWSASQRPNRIFPLRAPERQTDGEQPGREGNPAPVVGLFISTRTHNGKKPISSQVNTSQEEKELINSPFLSLFSSFIPLSLLLLAQLSFFSFVTLPLWLLAIYFPLNLSFWAGARWRALRKQPQGSRSGTLISTQQTATPGRMLPAAEQAASWLSSRMTPDLRNKHFT